MINAIIENIKHLDNSIKKWKGLVDKNHGQQVKEIRNFEDKVNGILENYQERMKELELKTQGIIENHKISLDKTLSKHEESLGEIGNAMEGVVNNKMGEIEHKLTNSIGDFRRFVFIGYSTIVGLILLIIILHFIF